MFFFSCRRLNNASLVLFAATVIGATLTQPLQANPKTKSEEALAYFQAKQWEKAADTYKQVVAANPYQGAYWHNYGFALHSLQRYDEARSAFEKSAELGFVPASALYNIACGYSLQHQKRLALDYLDRALKAGYVDQQSLIEDTDLDFLRNDQGFRKLVGIKPDGEISRRQAWEYDLDFLARRMEQVHYNLYGKVSRKAFNDAIESLKSRIDKLQDHEIRVGIQRILAMVGDGHTTLTYGDRHGGHAQSISPTLIPHAYPVEFYDFSDGVFVVGASPEQKNILGCKVVQIGNAPVSKALETAGTLVSRDNAMGLKFSAPQFLRGPEVLHAIGLTDNPQKAKLVVASSSGKQTTVSLNAGPLDAVEGLVAANEIATNPKPLYLTRPKDMFWFEDIKDRHMIYCQYNGVLDKHEETLADFWKRMFQHIDQGPFDYLVIDMRNNSGGNNTLNKPLIHGLIKCEKINERGHLFVIVGRRTFSAAMNCAEDIERNTKAIFVGEPTGSSPNFVGESTPIRLPCSGLTLSCSSLFWQSSTPTDKRTWIAPQLLAEMSSGDYLTNRDPAMERIFEYVGKPE